MPLVLGGTIIPPGEHTVFIELARDKSTLMISALRARTGDSGANPPGTAFGAFEHTPAKDLVPSTRETLLMFAIVRKRRPIAINPNKVRPRSAFSEPADGDVEAAPAVVARPSVSHV